MRSEILHINAPSSTPSSAVVLGGGGPDCGFGGVASSPGVEEFLWGVAVRVSRAVNNNEVPSDVIEEARQEVSKSISCEDCASRASRGSIDVSCFRKCVKIPPPVKYGNNGGAEVSNASDATPKIVDKLFRREAFSEGDGEVWALKWESCMEVGGVGVVCGKPDLVVHEVGGAYHPVEVKYASNGNYALPIARAVIQLAMYAYQLYEYYRDDNAWLSTYIVVFRRRDPKTNYIHPEVIPLHIRVSDYVVSFMRRVYERMVKGQRYFTDRYELMKLIYGECVDNALRNPALYGINKQVNDALARIASW